MSIRKKDPRKGKNQTLVAGPGDVQTSKTQAVAENIAVQEPTNKPAVGFPIVGIGASAGGLAAFEAFFSGMPAKVDPGMAFVLVQHLAPDHKSILTDLIRRYTRMQVFEVEDGMTVQPNCTYIIPPGRDMAFLNGNLQLLEPSAPRGQRLPIDFFFRSLAQDQRERAIGIVLSGTGSDGTLGVRAIKGEGGMVMAQNPESTEYDGMPSSAIATGLVDYELPPAEMPDQLIAFAGQAYGRVALRVLPATPQDENAQRKIFVLLRSQTGHDFSGYKPSTIQRRIARRLAVHQIETRDQYVAYLQKTPTEVEALFRDLLIGVTNFFRDPEAFKVLEEKIIPKLFADKPAGSLIRIWSTGCSTGEEAYSLAIILAEYMESLKQSYKVQIFATDIDSKAIATARAGVYPASIATDLTPERLARYFSAESDDSLYRIHKNIRDMLVFSEQNVIKDPPFSKLDLISCRNLLIYLSGGLQKKLIPLFHYALNPGGTLFLGTSETIGEFSDLFHTLDRKSKVYTSKNDLQSTKRSVMNHFHSPLAEANIDPLMFSGKKANALTSSLSEVTEQTLLQHVALAGALVNSSGDIFYLHGRTGMFLEPPPGETGIYNILKMAREGLCPELTIALHRAARERITVRRPNLRVKTNGDFTLFNLTIRRVEADVDTKRKEQLYLVILEESSMSDLMGPQPSFSPVGLDMEAGLSAGTTTELGTSSVTEGPNVQIAALRQELHAKEEYLQTANEELETSNEELKSSNEEMQSVNEELQSTNEELETSKEELQSVNEELATVNSELQTKVADLSQANNDMNNLLAGTGIATVFVDHSLRILRFTPSITKIINLILGDLGRPVGHIVANLIGYDHLVQDLRAVLDSLIPHEVEVQTTEGRWFTLRIQPYRTLENVIEGAVITFVDITEVKKNREALRRSERRYRGLMTHLDAGVVVHGADTAIIMNNSKAAELLGLNEDQMTGKMAVDPVWNFLDRSNNPLPLNEYPVNRILSSKKSLKSQILGVIQPATKDIVWLTVNGFPVLDETGAISEILISFMDITARQLAEE